MQERTAPLSLVRSTIVAQRLGGTTFIRPSTVTVLGLFLYLIFED